MTRRRIPALKLTGLLLVAGLAAGLAVPPEAEAQYFGRNKVQYESFDFKVLKTEHFDIYYYEREEAIVRQAGRMAERWYSRLSRLLDHELNGRQPLILYDSHPAFEQTNAIFGQIGEATGGVTEALKRRIVLPLAGSLKDSDHVIGHELVHAFQFDITSGSASEVGFRAPTALFLPLWFIEGMAEYLSIGAVDPHTAMWMRDAAASDEDLPTLSKLANPKYFPYRYGHAFWAYVGGTWGDESIGKVLQVAGRSGDPIQALTAVLQISSDSLNSEWHAAINRTYNSVVSRTKQPADYGPVLVSKQRGSGGLNVGPALSPDGSKVVFLSEKDLFSIEMFLADANTGQVEKRLTKTASDPHFESLQFINSAGAWSADSKLFAFGAIVKGQPAISIVEVESGKTVQEIRLPELGEVFTPTFSPDGRSLAFAATANGMADLFVMSLEDETVRRLTNDLYTDLQPAWSPDGSAIAFVTDRFSTDAEKLEYGNYRLATIDPASGEIQALPVFGRGKHINPQWSADGQSLYFVTDVSGISDIYRYEFAGGGLFQITNLTTGASGITALSPALSSASGANRLVYAAYEDGDYNLYAIDDPEVLAGTPIRGAIVSISPAVLPPEDRQPGLISTLLDAPELGLADTLTFDREAYRATLALDFISQPVLAAGTSSFGSFIGGGISMYFSDMLGNRALSTSFNVNTQNGDLLRSSSVVVGYQNLSRRWNWGIQGGQIPFITQGFVQGIGTLDGETVFVEELQRFFQINRQLTGTLAYPFSKAQRVEFAAGVRHIDFAAEVERSFFDPVTFQLISRETFDLPSDTLPSIYLATASAALVYDNALFGGTGPILGQRYRLEASPNLGTLNYVNVLADFRKYFMPTRPVTIAFRGLTFGRYGADGEDPRLRPLYVGFPSLVRGYDDNSFDISECGVTFTTTGGCPVFDQLFGSRLALFNAEVRLPLLGGFGLIPSGAVPPIEAIAFFDAGVAWFRGETPDVFGGDRNTVSSYGVGMRFNLLGLAIAEVDFVHPNDRPDKGWFWDFAFSSAF